MGGKNSKTAQVNVPVYKPVVTILSKVDDPHYGEVKIVTDNKTGQKMIQKELVFTSKPAYQSDLEYIIPRVATKHPQIVNIIGYNVTEESHFCANNFRITLYIEINDKTLQTDLENRIVNKKPYSENELLIVAEDLLNGTAFLQSHNYAHGDIRPANVFVNSTTNKLSDPSLYGQKGTSGLGLAILNQQKTLLSPQMLSQVPNKVIDYKGDAIRADVFSLGATLLSMATLTHSQDFYDYSKGTINNTLLNGRIEAVKQSYSPFTYDLIKSMLKTEEAGRPDMATLLAKVSPLHNQIRAGKPVATNPTVVTPNQLINTTTPIVNPHRISAGETYPTQTITVQPNNDLEARLRDAIRNSQSTLYDAATRNNQPITIQSNTQPIYTNNYSAVSEIQKLINTTNAPFSYTPSTYSTVPATTYSTVPTTYSTVPATTYSTTPITTYSETPITYSSIPATTYSAVPTTTYAEHNPITYTNTIPTTTYNTVPATTYSATPITTYAEHNPITYTNTIPTTTYNTVPATTYSTVPTTTYNQSYVTGEVLSSPLKSSYVSYENQTASPLRSSYVNVSSTPYTTTGATYSTVPYTTTGATYSSSIPTTTGATYSTVPGTTYSTVPTTYGTTSYGANVIPGYTTSGVQSYTTTGLPASYSGDKVTQGTTGSPMAEIKLNQPTTGTNQAYQH